MAGSYNHLVAEDGSFSMELIENMGDAHEALEECFEIITSARAATIAHVGAAILDAGVPDLPPRLQNERDDHLMHLRSILSSLSLNGEG